MKTDKITKKELYELANEYFDIEYYKYTNIIKILFFTLAFMLCFLVLGLIIGVMLR